MVYLFKIATVLFCLVSVSAVEEALLEKFAEAAVNGINNDKDSGPMLFQVYEFYDAEETDAEITFVLIAVRTDCPKKPKEEKAECNMENPTDESLMLQHNVSATKKGTVYSVSSAGPVDTRPGDTLGKIGGKDPTKPNSKKPTCRRRR